MKLALSSLISEIDRYAKDELGIPTLELMKRSGKAVADAVRQYAAKGREVVILAGKGNNGADGYAAATLLLGEYPLVVFDVFGVGQKSEEGKTLTREYLSKGGEIIPFEASDSDKARIKSAGCIVDAVFGTGFKGEVPEHARALAVVVSEAMNSVKIAVDVPLGVGADDGSIDDCAAYMNATVELSYVKPGIVSFPARAYAGKIIHDTLGLPIEKINEKFDFKYHLTDFEYAKTNLPKREENSSKGTFGKTLIITGSEDYRGAGRLSLEAALRGGAGYVRYLGAPVLIDEYIREFPEAIYTRACLEEKEDRATARELSQKSNSTLIGSGSGNTGGVADLTCELLSDDGGVLILDADAINALALRPDALSLIKNARRPVILTPHPLEFARLTGDNVATVQKKRLAVAVRFASENKCILVLKGAGTIVTDGKEVYVNGSGSSALAKAGSGDVLAGFIASLTAQNIPPVVASALGVYFHGKAADELAREFSTYGVTPSDLPKQIAREIAKTENA